MTMPQARRVKRRIGVAVIVTAFALLPGMRSFVVSAGGATPAFVQGTATTTSSKVTLSKPVTAGDLLVAGITTSDSGTDPVSGVSDTLNGSWTRAASLRYGNGHVDLFYFAGSAAGSDTVTKVGSGAYTLAEYSGVRGSAALDAVASLARTGSPAAGPTVAIGGANELVIGLGGMSAPGTFSAGTGFTLREAAVSNYLYGAGLEDRLSTSSAGQSMTMAVTGSGYSGGIVAVFKAVPPATPPTAALTVTPSSGAAPLPVTANASASTPGSNPISTYTFNFGDGTTVGPQAGATATHTYAAGGTFTVTMTVTDSASLSATASQVVSVGAPVAALSVSPPSGPTPLPVTANASASTDPIGISAYTFNFGDGTTVGPQAGATATHTYSAGGSFTVSVTVIDSAGATATASKTVVVNTPPTAALAVTPNSGATPLPVTADASASTPGSNPISTYTFNFGDGTTVGPQDRGNRNPHLCGRRELHRHRDGHRQRGSHRDREPRGHRRCPRGGAERHPSDRAGAAARDCGRIGVNGPDRDQRLHLQLR